MVATVALVAQAVPMVTVVSVAMVDRALMAQTARPVLLEPRARVVAAAATAVPAVPAVPAV